MTSAIVLEVPFDTFKEEVKGGEVDVRMAVKVRQKARLYGTTASQISVLHHDFSIMFTALQGNVIIRSIYLADTVQAFLAEKIQAKKDEVWRKAEEAKAELEKAVGITVKAGEWKLEEAE